MMIGRASIGNPWIFREIKNYLQTGNFLPKPAIEERVEVCKTHLQKSIAWKGPKTGILEMRRHYANYFKGIGNFKETRMRLVASENLNEIYDILEGIKTEYACVMA